MCSCHQQPADHFDGCRNASCGCSLWGVAGLEGRRPLIKDRASAPSGEGSPCRAFLTARTVRRTQCQEAFWQTWAREADPGCRSDLSELSNRMWE